jgi:hypothetical protein
LLLENDDLLANGSGIAHGSGTGRALEIMLQDSLGTRGSSAVMGTIDCR